MTTELRDVVREVREYIEEHGWCKGSQYDEYGAACIWGAYWEVANRRFSLNGMSYGFGNAVGAGLPVSDHYKDLDSAFKIFIDPIILFNDDPKTTIEDVLLHLKQVEERLEAGS